MTDMTRDEAVARAVIEACAKKILLRKQEHISKYGCVSCDQIKAWDEAINDLNSPSPADLVAALPKEPLSPEAIAAGMKFCCGKDERNADKIAKLRNVIQRGFHLPEIRAAWEQIMNGAALPKQEPVARTSQYKNDYDAWGVDWLIKDPLPSNTLLYTVPAARPDVDEVRKRADNPFPFTMCLTVAIPGDYEVIIESRNKQHVRHIR